MTRAAPIGRANAMASMMPAVMHAPTAAPTAGPTAGPWGAAAAPADVSLSLVSHTNVGKTTLARTLLGRDIGVVRDEAHVTEAAEAHVLQQSPAGDRLLLWDTPGFGDSLRLARRLAQVGTPLGWLLTEVWDRWRDRPFWASQHAVRHVLGQADVVLYLANAAEAPEDAPYLDAELQVLALVGKPVVALLNQTGPAGAMAADDEAALLARWQAHLGRHAVVRAVLPLDAFTRCWVQEALLWQAVQPLLPGAGGRPGGTTGTAIGAATGAAAVAAIGAGTGRAADPVPQAADTPPSADKAQAFARLQQAWQQAQWQRWHQVADELARRLARAALDHEPVPDPGWARPLDKVRGLGTDLGKAVGGGVRKVLDAVRGRATDGGAPDGPEAAADAAARILPPDSPAGQALARLSARLHDDLQASMQVLIRLHGLDGAAGRELLQRLQQQVQWRQPVDAGSAAVWGGLVSGAVAGLKADLLSGGLSLGGGALVGGALGALGAAGVAKGVNHWRGLTRAELVWDAAAMDQLLRHALLGWLAVAHHGRGRGAWLAPAPPPTWTAALDAVLAERQALWAGLWTQRQALVTSDDGQGVADDQALHAWQARIADALQDTARALLAALYPAATAVVTS